ncbi:hypothetical protein [Streptomyces sp. NPDC001205]
MDRTDHPIPTEPRPSVPPAAMPAEPTKWFWLMTAQTPPSRNGSFGVATYSATVSAQPGDTRDALYREIRKYVMSAMGADDLVVLHFSLELNTLGGAA